MFPEDARVAEAARRMDAPATSGARADVDMGDLAERVAAELERRPLHVRFLGHDGMRHIAASWGMETPAGCRCTASPDIPWGHDWGAHFGICHCVPLHWVFSVWWLAGKLGGSELQELE